MALFKFLPPANSGADISVDENGVSYEHSLVRDLA
jgi:hypothetical protein